MSMRDYSFSDYGMIIDAEAGKLITKNESWFNGLLELAENGEIDYCFGFSGESFGVDDSGRVCYEESEESFAEDYLFYIGLNKYPTLFTKAYDSMADVVNEIRRKTKNWLPSDFDIRSRIRFFEGSYYG